MADQPASRSERDRGTEGPLAAGTMAADAIVYMTETPAAALLEVCVHTSANHVPPKFTLAKIEGPDIAVPSVKADDLRTNWQTEGVVPAWKASRFE